MAESSNAKDVDDLCICGKGRLHEGFTELKIRIENTLLVVKNVLARVCDLCDEAYISPETSRLVDRVMEMYRAGRLEVKANCRWRNRSETECLRYVIYVPLRK